MGMGWTVREGGTPVGYERPRRPMWHGCLLWAVAMAVGFFAIVFVLMQFVTTR